MHWLIYGVISLAVFVVFVVLSCFVQAALEKMNLILGAYNNVGWPNPAPGQKEMGIMAHTPQIREYPPGYPKE